MVAFDARSPSRYSKVSSSGMEAGALERSSGMMSSGESKLNA